MITQAEYHSAVEGTLALFAKAHIAVTEEEAASIEVADFGLSNLREIGLQLLVYVNTPRVCAKEMALFPGQTCPEHMHPPVEGEPGKEETFRCRYGECHLFVCDPAYAERSPRIPASRAPYFTACREIVLRPGEQYTIYPGTLHWFTAGDEGAVVSEFSTTSRDETDIFTDPAIQRAPVVEG